MKPKPVAYAAVAADGSESVYVASLKEQAEACCRENGWFLLPLYAAPPTWQEEVAAVEDAFDRSGVKSTWPDDEPGNIGPMAAAMADEIELLRGYRDAAEADAAVARLLADKLRLTETEMDAMQTAIDTLHAVQDQTKDPCAKTAIAAARLMRLRDRLKPIGNVDSDSSQPIGSPAKTNPTQPRNGTPVEGSVRNGCIADRLREASHFALMDAARPLLREAADEIELLREGRKLDGESIGVLVGECQAMLGRAIDCQEWSETSAALLWKIQVQSNIISRLKAALEKR